MTVDFHVHSTASDGTCAPAELAAAASDFSAIAITDHDNADGAEEFLSAPAREGLRRFAGIELSIEPGEGFDRFHLLGIGIDPHDENLKRFLRRVLDGRNGRNAKMLENFARIGIDIPRDEIALYAHGEVLARPHFARWLVDHGYAADVSVAFSKYLLGDSPAATRCYESRWHPPQEEAFSVIHAAGGLAVMAHPKYWRDAWKSEGCDFAAAERELAVLKEKGLDGLESLYQANSPEENIAFTRIADSLGLLKTAGSDFHGANKKAIPLGMNVSVPFIGPFLEALERPRRTAPDV